jgi:V/A-type H+-transporting ATPase subunit D
MEAASPTRTELLARRAQVRLAESGVELLKGKREALVREFVAGLKRFAAEREAQNRAMSAAVQALLRTLAHDGRETVASVGLASRRTVEVELAQKNIWGIRVTEVATGYHPRPAGGHRFSALGSSARTEDAAQRFEEALSAVIRAAPLDRMMRRLAEEIRKTSRRVNALEQSLLPRLRAEAAAIRSVLDQREREDVFRLKRLKRKHAGRGVPAHAGPGVQPHAETAC